MNHAGRTAMRLAMLAAAVAVAACAAFVWWRLCQARGAAGPRDAAAPLSAREQAAAQRFFAQAQDLQARFLAVTEAARRREKDGADVTQVRGALAAAMAEAAAGNAGSVELQIGLAEQALERIDMLPAGVVAGTAEELAAMIDRIEPAYRLGREFLTEGHAAAEKLLGRASREYQAGEIERAAALVHLAAALLGVETAAPADPAMPEWFDALADAPATTASDSQAEAAVALAEAMAMSENPARPIASLVERARRELKAGRPGDAYFWAGVALNALGMTDEAVAAAAGEGRRE